MRVALTFDDGPSPWTESLLDAFAAHGQHATFFVLGSAVAARPWLAARCLREGHELGLHGFTHTPWPWLDAQGLRDELAETTRVVREVAAGLWSPRLCRPPFHNADAAVREVLAELGLTPVGAQLDPGDWKRNTDEILASFQCNAEEDDIVDLHDGVPPGETGSREATVEAVQALLAAGLESVTVSELWSAH